MKNGLIILDAGHGKETPGKRSPIWSDGSQLFEWEFNRAIVAKISRLLTNAGIQYYKIINIDIDVTLENRVADANKIYYDNINNFDVIFFLSIHANAGGGTGWEAWTSPGQTESDNIADFLYTSAKDYWPNRKIRMDNSDGDDDKESNFYVLKYTDCPAILTENFFMDTEDDCRYIMSDQGREDVAQMHFNAIVNYLNN